MRTRILVVGRDMTVRARLARMLSAAGYRVELAESAAHARRIEHKGLALAVIAPEGLGREGDGLIEELKSTIGKTLLLSDGSDEAGLLARVAEALRPAPEADAAEPMLLFAGFRLDLAGCSLVDPSGQEIPLTRSEFGLLQAFAQRPGRVLSRDQLLNALAGREAEAYDRSIDMLVVRLRRKIEPDPKHPALIITIPGRGYKFALKVRQAEVSAVPEPEPAAAPPAGIQAATERRYVTALAAELLAGAGAGLPGDPEELLALIDAFRRYAAAVIARHGGAMTESRGREVLAYFGYPVAQEYAAERALHAALALADHLAEGELALPAGLAVRVGVASGLVIADPAGEVRGETPGEAARLLTLAEPGQVIVAASTRRLAGGLFTYRDLGPLAVKGVAGPVQAWQVLGASTLASRSEALHADALTPLVDREEERALLLRAWQQAKTGEGRLVLLSGEPGIGKSRLFAAFEEELADEPHASLRYFCSPLHQDGALHPIIARWEREAGFARGDSAEVRLRKLEALLAPANLPPEDVALIAAMLSVPTGEHYPRLDFSPQWRKERTFAALHRRLVNLARTGPMLMLFEDAHWADPSSLELLDRLADRLAELPILLIVSYRPEFAAPWIGRAGASLIALSRLNPRHAATLAAQVTAERVLTPALLERIVTQTDGVPLFIEELTKAVLETSGETHEAPLALAVPGTLQASLMARLDRLPAAKQVAQIGAVIGREFSRALLATVAELPEAQLTQGLDELVASGLAFRRGVGPDAVYTFKHALVQDAAYGALLRGRRQQLHAHIAVVLENQFAEFVRTKPELLAFHHQHAGNVEQSFKYWTITGDVSEQHGASSEAIVHYRTANRLLEIPDLPHTVRLREPELGIKLGNALMQVEGYNSEDGRQAFHRARSAAEKLELPEEYARAGIGIAPLLFGQCRYREVIGIGEGISTRSLDRISPQTRVHLWTVLSVASYCIGEFTTAIEYATRAAKLDDNVQCTHENPVGGGDPAIVCRAYAGMIATALGLLEESAAWSEEALAVADARGHAFSMAWARLNRMRSLHALGRDEDLVSIGNEAIDICERHGFDVRLGNVLVYHGAARFAIGEQEEGLADMCRGIALWRRTSGMFHVTQWISELVPCLLQFGRTDAAARALQEAEELISKTEENSHCSEIRRLRGQLHEAAGEKEQAGLCYLQALEWSRAQHGKLFELRASTRLARLWRDQGRAAEAHELLAPVYGWFTEGRDAPDLKEASALLDDLVVQ